LLRNLAQVFSNNESWSQVAFPKEIEPAKPLAASLLEAGDEDADLAYLSSTPAGRVGIFISHVWTSSRWRKFLALCFCLNVDIAVSCAILVWLCLVCLGIATSGIFGLGGKTYLIPLFVHIPVAVFFVVFFFGHHLRSGPQMWLDKLCIHQTRQDLKEKGLKALPEIVTLSDRMLILWDPEYFERLWCCAEVAIFCSTKSGADQVDFVPLWMAPWVLSTVLAQVLSISISERLFSLIGSTGVYLSTLPFVPPGIVTLLAMFWGIGVGFWLGALPAAPLSYYALTNKITQHRRMRKIFKTFRVQATKCAVPADRNRVMDMISDLYREGADDSLHAFNIFVRKDLSRKVERNVGKSETRIRYRLCLLMFLPIALSSAANVLGCDGMECDVAAVAELGPGAKPPVQMVTNALAWLVGVFGIYPSTYPVMLKFMSAIDHAMGTKSSRNSRTWAVTILRLLSIVASYAYMGFAEGLAAGLLNSVSSRLVGLGIEATIPWLVALCIYFLLLLTWNAYLYK